MTRTALHFNFLVFSLVTGFFLNSPTHPTIRNPENTVPDFASFSRSVQNGEANTLRGAYVPDLLAVPVVQQPKDQPFYVSNRDGELTQFAAVSRYGNTGLLAHNLLSGRLFSSLTIGQEVRLVYGDGKVEYFVVAEILRFQALQPESVTSSFRNLDQDEVLTASAMFNRAYTGKRHLVFQTCIEANGNASWGRLFVIAVPRE
jgi:hypothetical protein